MSWADFTGKAYSRDDFVRRMNSLAWSGEFRPQGIVLHNTAAPTLAQWAEAGAAHDARIKNLKSYYEGLGWHAGPHWFISREWINEFMNPTTRGTHSPSYNSTHFGIEMVGDYDREEFNSGDGALVRDNAVFVVAYLCKRFGWDPGKVLKLHKEDPKTTHACPGKKVVKADFIARVRAAMDGTVIDDSARAKMAQMIIDSEARRDSKGHLEVYKLPPEDGGGEYEVAGFNDKYHPTEFATMRDLIQSGKYDEAEKLCRSYVLRDTAPAASWVSDLGLEYMLRDSIHHRGPTGAMKILQRALGVEVDGDFGPKTAAAVSEIAPRDLLTKLRAAREEYELDTYGKRMKFWDGFVNRWNRVLRQSIELDSGAVGGAGDTTPPSQSLVGKNDRSEDVRHLQKLLGFSSDEQDGIFGNKTEMAVKWFQRSHRLPVDGVVGDDTWSALETLPIAGA